MTPRKDKDGYKVVTLRGREKNSKAYYRRINRLVAKSFIPNPHNYPVVNHIDEIKDNDNVNNLEWCTVAYNNRYSKCRPVVQLSIDGEYINRFDSLKDAADEYDIAITHIQDCCAKKPHYKTYKGYQWVHEEDYDKNINYMIVDKMQGLHKRLVQYDVNGNVIKTYNRLRDVSDDKLVRERISKVCSGNNARDKTAYGYKWKYIN